MAALAAILISTTLEVVAPLVDWLVFFRKADEKFLGLIDKVNPPGELLSLRDSPSFHIVERDGPLGEELAAEVKKNNPDAEILKDKAMVDAFETYLKSFREQIPVRVFT